MKPGTPLLSQPRVQRVLYPVLIGVVLVALWQWMVVAMDLPPYLVPSPYLMMQTLVNDWAPLGSALVVTLKITVLSFLLATVAGVLMLRSPRCRRWRAAGCPAAAWRSG